MQSFKLHQGSLTSGFLSPEDDLHPETIVLERGCHFPVSAAGQWYFKALLPAHSLNRLWLSHGAPEKDVEQKKKWRLLRAREKCKGLAQVKENV